MKVFWTPPARTDLQSAVQALADEGEVDFALGLLAEADRVDALLRRIPFAGPRLEGCNDRKLRLGRLPFVVRYRIKNGTLEILRLHHARSDWQSFL
ncbi:MAG: type II toxin-antitoxin system RelE/ParE family toxin [Sphingopyxis sp.]